MRIRRGASPLLLLIPALLSTAVLALPGADTYNKVGKQADGRDTKIPGIPSTDSVTPSSDAAAARAEVVSSTNIGTKYAPVDGRDGKPHAGPFVDTDKKKTAKEDEEELVTGTAPKKPVLKDAPADPTIVDGKRIPEKNDGIMNDENRQVPKEGTTGTEGGVSQKAKEKSAQEKQTGEKVENTPVPPKEKPPLPHSEQEKLSGKDKAQGKDAKLGKDFDEVGGDASELTGLEVLLQAPILYFNCSNIKIETARPS